MRDTLPSGTPVEIHRPSASTDTGLVIAPDIGGLRPLFSELAAQLAVDRGWAVAAVEPFPGRESMRFDERMAAVGTMRDEEKTADLTQAADLLNVPTVNLLGFCMGGMWAMKASTTDRFERVVAFYGIVRNLPAWRTPANRDALEVLREHPDSVDRLLAIFGTADEYVPMDEIDQLRDLGVHLEIHDGAGHSFAHVPDHPSYDKEAADRAWASALAWLAPSSI